MARILRAVVGLVVVAALGAAAWWCFRGSPPAEVVASEPSGPSGRDDRATDPVVAAVAAPKTFSFASGCRTIDPALALGPDEERLVLACFEGLTVIDSATGEVKPGAAASWTTSADGRTWTFRLREATWQKKAREGFDEKGTVKASDFVFAWRRLLDPTLASPHAHLLDVLDGVPPLSTDKPRGEALDRIVTDLLAAIGGEAAPKTMAPEQVRMFVHDPDRAVVRWLGELDTPEAREFLAWPEDRTYEGVRAMALVKILRRARDAALVAAVDADAHVGVDRGFFAPDARTLVVRVRGASPWLPSLLARAPLVPVNEKVVTSKRDWAFSKAENQVCNGRFVASSDFRPQGTESDSTGDTWAVKASLFKNAKHHDAARTAADRVTVFVDYGADEVLRRYALGDVAWILPSALPFDVERQIRASTAAGWEPDPKAEAQRYFRGAARGAYEVPAGRVKVLRFRAAGPFATRAARVAVASLASRDDLAARAGSVVPPILTARFVHSRTTGRLDLPRAVDVVPGRGAAPERRGATLRLLAGPADAGVAALLAERWKAAGDEAVTTLLDPSAPAAAMGAGGAWDVWLDDVRAAYDDPLAFLDPFTTQHPAGACAWSDPRYDALVAGAHDVVGFAAAPTPAVAALPAVAGALASGDLERLRRVLLAEAEAILLEEAIVVPLWVPADTGFVAQGVRGLPTGRVWGRRSVLDVVPFAFAAADRPADGGGAAGAGGERR